MQASNGIGTFVVVVTVDIFQSALAVIQVMELVRRSTQLESKINKAATAANVNPVHDDVPCVRRTVFETAASILNTNEIVRLHPQVSMPRRVRGLTGHTRVWRVASSARLPAALRMGVRPLGPSRPSVREQEPNLLSQFDNNQLKYVRCSLTLLHMLEFYILTEFSEVLIAIIYFVYLLAMAKLPNRAYYVQLVEMTDEQWQSTMRYVAKYAAYELASFLVLVVNFDRVLNISSINLMAFALHKHRRLVQAALIVWVFITVQLTLEHFGNDYTFQFKWLRPQTP